MISKNYEFIGNSEKGDPLVNFISVTFQISAHGRVFSSKCCRVGFNSRCVLILDLRLLIETKKFVFKNGLVFPNLESHFSLFNLFIELFISNFLVNLKKIVFKIY